MVVLLETSAAFERHRTGAGHPEAPSRLRAVLDGIAAAGLSDLVVPVEPPPAARADLERVHPAALLDALEQFSADGGGVIDADTVAGEGSWAAAVRAAGAGLDAVERLDRGEAEAAFCAVRPPGHHATRGRPMGFCLLNSIAVTAAALVARGERVLVVDWDVHHGNGTQDVFYEDPRVLFVSLHRYGAFYPGTGSMQETGAGAGLGTTVNVPFPPGTAGDAYRAAFAEVLDPAVERFGPTWVLLSAGFDAHRADPLADAALSAGDFADLTARTAAYAPAGRRIAFLEGGYDLDALALSAAACVGALAGERLRPEVPTSGEIGLEAVARVVEHWARAEAGG
ncbi:MAG TPA: histone deacetylase [Acidimicrobiales bacterium]|nr:histone deacetylase [Acidimicrobiales bacterium]